MWLSVFHLLVLKKKYGYIDCWKLMEVNDGRRLALHVWGLQPLLLPHAELTTLEYQTD